MPFHVIGLRGGAPAAPFNDPFHRVALLGQPLSQDGAYHAGYGRATLRGLSPERVVHFIGQREDHFLLHADSIQGVLIACQDMIGY